MTDKIFPVTGTIRRPQDRTPQSHELPCCCHVTPITLRYTTPHLPPRNSKSI